MTSVTSSNNHTVLNFTYQIFTTDIQKRAGNGSFRALGFMFVELFSRHVLPVATFVRTVNFHREAVLADVIVQFARGDSLAAVGAFGGAEGAGGEMFFLVALRRTLSTAPLFEAAGPDDEEALGRVVVAVAQAKRLLAAGTPVSAVDFQFGENFLLGAVVGEGGTVGVEFLLALRTGESGIARQMRLHAYAAEQVAAGQLQRLFEQGIAEFAQMSRRQRLDELARGHAFPIQRSHRTHLFISFVFVGWAGGFC